MPAKPRSREQKDLDDQLYNAAYFADHIIIADLLRQKASPNAPQREDFPRTPIYACLLRGDRAPRRHMLNPIEQLLAAGADPNAADPEHKFTLLCYAARDYDADVVKLLLKYGANPNLESPPGIFPLQASMDKNITRSLCARDADPLLKNSQGVSSLEYHAHRPDLFEAMAYDGYLVKVSWHNRKIETSDMVDDKGEKTPLLSHFLKNGQTHAIACPSRYREGIAGIARVYPHLSPELQAGIDLSAWRRSLAATNQSSAVARYLSATHPGKERNP